MIQHSEMIERVAKVLASRFGGILLRRYDLGKDDMVPCTFEELPQREIYYAEARAAIEAMREPTDEMIEAGEFDSAGDFNTPFNAWRMMIDKALE